MLPVLGETLRLASAFLLSHLPLIAIVLPVGSLVAGGGLSSL